mmetsp:Transcript_4140/g.8870  ORF Transcript_4140/g.8870 Transcript_4140/m.8870 type:complete len:274 (-) Transcript_4140:936-1757(-)
MSSRLASTLRSGAPCWSASTVWKACLPILESFCCESDACFCAEPSALPLRASSSRALICAFAASSSASSAARCCAISCCSARACSLACAAIASRVAAASSRSADSSAESARCSSCSSCIAATTCPTSSSPSLSSASASSTTSRCMPRRRAMAMALERPGMPHSSRYVGASATSSNSTHAFSKRGSEYLSVLSDPWCVVQTASAAVAARRRSTAVPSAEPSVGSVPAPTSSSSTRELRVTCCRIACTRATCAEKVESDCTMDWSSPMSAITLSK